MLAGTDPPYLFHPLRQKLFATFLGGMVVATAAQGVGKAVHVGDFVFFVVRVAIALGITDFLHESRGSIAQVQRDRLLAGVLDLFLHRTVRGIDRVGLG